MLSAPCSWDICPAPPPVKATPRHIITFDLRTKRNTYLTTQKKIQNPSDNYQSHSPPDKATPRVSITSDLRITRNTYMKTQTNPMINHCFWISFQDRLSLTSLRHRGWLQACLLENWLLMKFDARERPSFLPTIYWPGLLNYSHSEHNMWIKLLHTTKEMNE